MNARNHAKLLCLSLLTTLLPVFQASAQALRIFHIDVDQADSTLVVTPGGRTLLIDAGLASSASRIQSVMTANGLTQIDHLVVSHYDGDH